MSLGNVAFLHLYRGILNAMRDQFTVLIFIADRETAYERSY